MRSHVFVLRGDLMQLTCDAWLVPGSERSPGESWRTALPPQEAWLELPAGWSDEGRPRARLLAEVSPTEPLPFLTDVIGTKRDGPPWYVEGARHFVQLAARVLRDKKRAPLFGRHKHLLALPLAGTGGGGGARLSGEVVRLLLPALHEEAEAADVDVALVLRDGPAWAAAQHERAAIETWATLSPGQLAAADALASKARSGDLVVFLGAGVSQGAGLPSWTTMLEDLAEERAGVDDAATKAALAQLGELDRAAVIQRRLHDQEPLGAVVAALLRERARRHALGHGLLASLPVDEVITTNYDDLFERASLAVERPVTVLPGGEVARGQRWLLKMHGSVTKPETIVLTREDYLKFQENRTALAGIVQALLLTRHMLFVGFSFTDDNFHRIAHAVRQSIGPGKFGTTLVVEPNPLAEELWGGDLDWITFAGSLAEQARLVDIFLDRMAQQAAAATAHLGDRRYDGVLTPGERALRERLEGFVGATSDEEKETGAWAEVERLLRRLGIRPGSFGVGSKTV